MKGKLGKTFLVAVSSVAMLLAATVPGWAVTGSDSTADNIDPILVRGDALVSNPTLRTTATPGANITGFELTASGTTITATITTRGAIWQCPAAPCAYDQLKPYGGQDLMVLFQTPELNAYGDIGCADVACTGQNHWAPLNPLDNFYWMLHFSANDSEQRNDASLGYYDPTGRLEGLPLEPGIGQTFFTTAQHKSTDCLGPDQYPGGVAGPLPAGISNNVTLSFPAANQVRMTVPYVAQWRTNKTCLGRSKEIIKPGETISNAVAFSWLDHEIGGPDPVGLILGWTWYTDSVPALESGSGYRVGTPAGDPNPSRYAGPKCPLTVRSAGPFAGGEVNPLYDGSPCTIVNPVGPGFSASNLNTTAG
ncbi:MAG: hypothetical protein ABR507_06260 [Actinomycetota bacterium]|nr:hypothetical protein [Actinomycetota bacterium]